MERKIKNGQQVLKFSLGENVFVATLETIVKLLIPPDLDTEAFFLHFLAILIG